ncbi:MAG: aminoglycoside phosphotransferase family protein [Bryobacteraceae bacterium]|nr:aminoglycoside phosphotransferase family protein [Bryobacteraceae bacterium]
MNDPSLPQLATALDAAAMAGILGRQCLAPAGRFQVRDCRISHIRYRPGRTCLIGYELRVRDMSRGEEFHHLLCGRMGEPAASAHQWRKALARPMAPVAAGAPVTHIPEMAMVVWAFPNERKLRGLARLLDPAVLRSEVLPALLHGEEVRAAASELVHYVPEHGCVVRVKADGRPALYAKAYADDLGERTFHYMSELWRLRLPGLVTARPVAYADRVLWQEEVSGIAVTPSGTDAVTACARALAELHQTALSGLPRAEKTPQDQLERTRRQAMEAGLDTRRLDAVIAELLARLPHLEPLPEATLHGDLHLKNFVLAPKGAALIDLDTLRRGNPLEDLGSFIANLAYRGAPEDVIASFLDAYTQAVPWRVSEAALAWHAVFSLIAERVFRSISRRKCDTEATIERAEKLLARSAASANMERFRRAAQAVDGEPLDIFYKTYRRHRSLPKSEVTVCYRTPQGAIGVRRIGPDPASWFFPHDPAMPWLALVPQHLPVSTRAVDVRILNYRPLNRCTSRYRLDTDNGRVTIYGKTYCDERGLAVHQRFEMLWKLSREGGPEFPMGRPLGYCPETRTVWQQAFPGEPLVNRLKRGGFDAALAGAAQRLAFLHRSRIECPHRMTLDEQLQDLDKKMEKLAFVLPALETRLRRMVRSLGERLPLLSPACEAVVHGDFHLRQLMVNGNQTALFDFDEIGTGDPTEDLGRLLADLESYGFASPLVGRIRTLVLTAYEEAAGDAIPADRLAWHTAVQLLTCAYRGLLQLRWDMEERAAAMLTLAEAQR